VKCRFIGRRDFVALAKKSESSDNPSEQNGGREALLAQAGLVLNVRKLKPSNRVALIRKSAGAISGQTECQTGLLLDQV
jgi:hypothetical protein